MMLMVMWYQAVRHSEGGGMKGKCIGIPQAFIEVLRPKVISEVNGMSFLFFESVLVLFIM